MNKKIQKFGIVGIILTCLIALPCAFAESTPPAPAAASQKTLSASSEASVTVTPPAAQPETVSPGTSPDTISLDFKDADIASVLRILSMKSNINIVTGPEVKGLVTVRLDNVPWEKALDVILRTYDYVYERDGNVIRVTTRDKMKLEPVETRTFVLNYSKAPEIQTAIQDMLTERGKVKVAARTNMVVVTDIPTNLYRIGDVIEKLDKVTQQAYIDSKIVKTDLSNTEKLGIDWSVVASLSGSSRPTTFPFTSDDHGMPGYATQFFPLTGAAQAANSPDARAFPRFDAVTKPQTVPYFQYGTLDFTDFTAMLNLLETRVNTKIISNPRVLVLNNQTALVQVGQEIPIPSFERNETTGSMEVTGFSYRNTGVVLNVTPHINSNEEILVDLTPEVSSVGDTNQEFGSGQIEAPKFDTTKAKTQVLIQSGQTIAIGGLLTDATHIKDTKVPFLGDIPLVGKLFRARTTTDLAGTNPSTQKVETLFFVTVTTVDSQGQAVAKKDTGKNESQKTQVGEPTAATGAAPASTSSVKIVTAKPTPGITAA